MKVLFVGSGNSKNGISPVLENQKKYLENAGCKVDFFPIKGKGAKAYLYNIVKLRKFIKKHSYDVIHAHYLFSGLVAFFSSASPLIVSIMGSDLYEKKYYVRIVKIFIQISKVIFIVKSQHMKDLVGNEQIIVIPNGIDMDAFHPDDTIVNKRLLNWDPDKFHLLFPADPCRKEKNYELIEESVSQLPNAKSKIVIHTLHSIPRTEVVDYMNAADLVVLSSKWEGSPNVVKEAMACNKPVVSTNVGDVEMLFSNIEGYFIAKSDKIDFGDKINRAIEFVNVNHRTKGREQILKLGLDSSTIAERIVELYMNTPQKPPHLK